MNEKTPDFSITPLSILRDKRVTYRALKVYIAIRSFMNKETHECFPSRKLISYLADIPITRVSVETETLERLGWIQKTGKGGRSMSCTYKVFSSPQTVAESETVTSLETVINSVTVTESETVTDLDETVTDLSGNGYRFGMETVINSVTGKEQTIEQTKNREEQTSAAACASVSPVLFPEPPPPEKKSRSQKAKDFDLSTVELPDWMPTATWQEFVLHRQRIKAPMSAYAAGLMINKIAKARDNGWSPEQLMNDAIISGKWKDCVFEKHLGSRPPKSSGNNNQPINSRNLAPGYKSVSAVGV